MIKQAMIKQTLILGTLAISLTGCIVSPLDDDYSNRDHGRYDQRQHDSKRAEHYSYDRDRNQNHDRPRPAPSNQGRPNNPNWHPDQHRKDFNSNRPR